MATYIPGVTDYIPQIQPFRPDYNFLGNVMQTRQGRYDAAHKQINGIYGSILNSPMMRDSNIKRRDEFFKSIDGDIKRISGLDLSLQQNVDQAAAVFKPFFEDRNMFHDMTNTKRYQNGMDKHERLRNCVDCEDKAWEAGAAELQYKADEFRKMTDQEALNFQMPEYTSYYNWEKDAVKLANDAHLDVSQDTATGQWIMHDANGQLVQGGLLNLFKSTYGNDPRVAANYNTKAYVDRKNYIASNWQQHGSEEAAETQYLQGQIAHYNKLFSKSTEDVNNALTNVTERQAQLQKKDKTDGISSEEQQLLERISGVKEQLSKTQDNLEKSNYNVNNTMEKQDLTTLRRKGDYAAAQSGMMGDLYAMAQTMSLKGAKHTLSANPYGVIAVEQRNRKEMAAIGFEYDKLKKIMDVNGSKALMEFKHGLESGVIPGSTSSVHTLNTEAGYATAMGAPESGIERNAVKIEEVKQKSAAGSSEFLWSTLQTAKLAAKDNKAADIYLKSVFGDNYGKINTPQDMQKAIKAKGLTLEGAFDHTVKTLDQAKNPMANVSWAAAHMNTNSSNINTISNDNKAAYAITQRNLTVTKDIVSNIQRQAGPGQTAYADVDLLLTQSGVPMLSDKMPNEFVTNYMIKHPGVSVDTAYEVAKEMYEPLKDKFLETFNNTPNAMLDQGLGLKGGGAVTAYPMRYDNVNTKAHMDPGTQLLTGILKSVIPNPNSYNVIVGDPTKENIDKQVNNEQLKTFANQMLNDIMSTDKANPNIKMSFVESPIAGNDENMSAITIYPDHKYLESYLGTKAQPGVLAGVPGIANGITLYYNNKTVKTPTTAGLKNSTLVNTAKYDKLEYNYPGATETSEPATIHYDQSVGEYRFNAKVKAYENGKPVYHYISEPVSEAGLATADEGIKSMFALTQKKNLEIERNITAANKANPPK